MGQRSVQVKRGYEWIDIHFSDIVVGDNFRLFEPTGEEVIGRNNETIFHATSNSYKNENGVWQVDTV